MRPPRRGCQKLRYLFDKGSAFAVGIVAKEAPNEQAKTDRAIRLGQIHTMTGIATMDSGRRLSTFRARGSIAKDAQLDFNLFRGPIA